MRVGRENSNPRPQYVLASSPRAAPDNNCNGVGFAPLIGHQARTARADARDGSLLFVPVAWCLLIRATGK